MSRLRKESVIDLIGAESDDISGSKLPTVRQLLCVLFHRLKVDHDLRMAARFAVSKVTSFWNRTKIPRIQDIRAIEKTEALYKEYRSLYKWNSETSKVSATLIAKKKCFEDKLDKLFDISKKSAEGELTKKMTEATSEAGKNAWKEELLFLVDQRGPRISTIAGVDAKMKSYDRWKLEAEERSRIRGANLGRRKLKEESSKNLGK